MEFVYREIDFKRDACISTMISFKPQKNHWFVSCTLKKNDALWNSLSKCIKSRTKSIYFENYFQSAWYEVNAPWK